jgi:pimeloyl-ACP methyl ester carboxylesterase
MSTQELLQEGIEAVKAGNRDKAARLFALVVQNDAHSELGWLYLGMCRTNPKEKEFCFRRVLFLNPGNLQAQRQLEVLKGPAAPPPAASKPLEPVQPARSEQGPQAGPAIERDRREGPWNVTTPPAPQSRPPAQYQAPIEPAPAFGHLPSLAPAEPEAELAYVYEHRETVKPAPRKARRGRGRAVFASFLVVGALVAGGYWLWTQYRGMFVPPESIPASTPVSVATTPAEATPSPEAAAFTAFFEASACPPALPAGAIAECGFVVVPQVRGGDAKDTVRLAVIRYRSQTQPARSDPIIFLQGGPGMGALSWSVDAYTQAILPFLDTRDFIVFDPRGTGSSQPALKCDDFLRTYFLDMQGKLPSGGRKTAYQGAALTCKANLAQAGVKLTAYTAVDMAADVKDVLTALGYTQANLYAVGYGTRVAQMVMKNYPGIVQAAILDSAIPLGWQAPDHNSQEYNVVIKQVFDQCAADASCQAAYPALADDYAASLQKLEIEPVVLSVPVGQGLQFAQKVDAAVFQDAVQWMLRDGKTIPLVPQLIHLAAQGDYSLLGNMLAAPLRAYDSINMAAYISASCHDAIFTLTTATLDSVVPEMCSSWETKAVEPGENDLGVSGIPALLISGNYDPVIPASLSDSLSQQLTSSYSVLVADQGYGASMSGLSDCPARIMHAFMDSPYGEADTTCAQEIAGARFVVPYAEGTPLEMVEYQDPDSRLITRFPKDWKQTGPLLYMRSNSAIDTTQVGVQKAPVSEQQWLQTITANFTSGGALDTPPVQSDRLSANDLKWTIYKSTFKGQPVDIAFASSGPDTYMVVMLSAAEEHDALYKNAFLAVVGGTRPLE